MTCSFLFLYFPRMNLCRLLPTLLLMAVCVPNSGCSGSGNADSVRPDLAKDTLVSVLNSWKEGKPIESLQKASPAIVVQDVDWTAGAKLSGYELLSSGEAIGANLSIEVKLDLVDAEGKTETKQVWYLAGTDPVLTVFRDLLHP